VFDEMPHLEKVLKDTQNRDDPGIMAWDHYNTIQEGTRPRRNSTLSPPRLLDLKKRGS